MKRLWIICFLLLSVSEYSDAQKLTSYAKQRQQEIEEKQRVEKEKYEEACNKNSLAAYKEYQTLYPDGKYIDDVRNRLADYALWDQAKSANTIEAYNMYKSASTFKFFAADADAGIDRLKAVAAWDNVKNSTSIAVLQSYTQEYPQSPNLEDANKRIHELKGAEYYDSNNYLSAYEEFTQAGGRYFLEEANRSKFDACEEFVEYKQLGSYSSKETLMSFLNKYPTSKHKNKVSNLLAIAKAKDLTMFSFEYAYKDALNYATDQETRDIVNSYIVKSKKKRRQNKRRQRKLSHDANGRLIQYGFEPVDMGINPSALSEDFSSGNVFFYNLGVSVKIGNFKDPVQFEIGIKPGWVCYKLSHRYDEEETKIRFHLPIFARLKINLFSLGEPCKMYLCSTGYYNAVREYFVENEWAVSGGIGWSWKHCDLSTYYKVDLNNKDDLDNDYWGSSFVYYF